MDHDEQDESMWDDIPTELLQDLQNQLSDQGTSFEEWALHSTGIPAYSSFGSQPSIFEATERTTSTSSLFFPIKREDSFVSSLLDSAGSSASANYAISSNNNSSNSSNSSNSNNNSFYNSNSSFASHFPNKEHVAEAEALLTLSTSQTIAREPTPIQLPAKRMTLRELAREQAQRTPVEVMQQLPPLSPEEEQGYQKAKQITSQISQLQAKQEQQISDIKTMQSQLLRMYDRVMCEKLKEAIVSALNQIQIELHRLSEIVKTLVLDAEGLQTIRQLVQQLQIQSSQLELFQQELQQMEMPGPKVSVAKLIITEQPLPHVMFKGKVMEGSYTLNLITGANDNFSNLSDVQGVLVADGAPNPKKKPLENNVTKIDAVHKQASFNNVKVNVSTRMTLVYLKFGLQVKSLDRLATVESPLSYPFIVITNESQWVEAASKLIMLEAFAGAPTVSWPLFANTLHSHFISSTRQDPTHAERPLQYYELRFLHQKINGGLPMISAQHAVAFFTWFGNVERSLRFKRHVFSMWCNGYIYGFLSKEDAEKALTNQCVGAFLVRFSESQAGLFAVVSVSEDPEERIKHYLVKAEDIGSNKSLPDFLRESEALQYIMRTEPPTGKLTRYEKDVALKKFYSKRKLTRTKGYVAHI